MYVSNVSSVPDVCCKCFIWMLHIHECCNHMFSSFSRCFIRMFASVLSVASVSYSCFKCFIYIFYMLQLFYLDVSKVDRVLHMRMRVVRGWRHERRSGQRGRRPRAARARCCDACSRHRPDASVTDRMSNASKSDSLTTKKSKDWINFGTTIKRRYVVLPPCDPTRASLCSLATCEGPP